jgi:putative copper export protein
MTVIFVRSVAELATPYGAMLIAKTLGFGVAMALAALNRRRFALVVSGGGERGARSLRRTLAAEWGLLVVIFVTTAVMTSLYAPEHLEGAFGAGHGLEPTH